MSETGCDYEIIFVDDGSRDATFEIIQGLHQRLKRVKGIRFSRNFGHQNALMAGLQHASGDAVITMDADLQHPPELIPEMIEYWRDGQTSQDCTKLYRLSILKNFPHSPGNYLL